jgi:hypothetical protein
MVQDTQLKELQHISEFNSIQDIFILGTPKVGLLQKLHTLPDIIHFTEKSYGTLATA